MTKYLISFPGAAMDVPLGELQAVGDAARAVVQEAKDVGLLGVRRRDRRERPACHGRRRRDPCGRGAYPQTVQIEGGYSNLELPSYESALEWAAKFAAACRCAQEVRAFAYDPIS